MLLNFYFLIAVKYVILEHYLYNNREMSGTAYKQEKYSITLVLNLLNLLFGWSEDMETIVFIGCNKSGTSREAIKVAAEMGYFTVLFTDRKKFLEQREEFNDVDQLIYKKNLGNKAFKELLVQDIKRLIEEGKIVRACLSLVDPFVSMAAWISKELDLARVSIEALYTMENKTRFRDKLKHLPYNPFYIIYHDNHAVEQFSALMKDHFPVVLKSAESNGSKDVLLATNLIELKNGLIYLKNVTGKAPLLVEEYIHGPQFLVEVIVYKGRITIVGLLEQEVTEKKRFIVTGYHFPAQLSESQFSNLECAVNTIIDEIGLVNGTCHLEFRYSKGDWKLIEINPRISGGAMNRIIYHGTGVNLVKETLKLYLGEEPIIENNKNECVYTRYLTVDSKGILMKVTGKNRAKNQDGVKEVYIKPRKGSILTPPLSMGDRYAYVLTTASCHEEAKQLAIKALREIKFILEPL